MTHTEDRTGNDPFSQMWTDIFSRLSASGAGAMPSMPSAGASNESNRQMQKMFFDALTKYFDDFMRSEQFLSMMKQTMDRSLAFKQQVDQFLTKVHHGTQSPSISDMTDMAGTLRNIEERLLNRMESLEEKVAAVEEPGRTKRSARASRARPSADRAAVSPSKPKKKSKRK
jgi:hypothetical protein